MAGVALAFTHSSFPKERRMQDSRHESTGNTFPEIQGRRGKALPVLQACRHPSPMRLGSASVATKTWAPVLVRLGSASVQSTTRESPSDSNGIHNVTYKDRHTKTHVKGLAQHFFSYAKIFSDVSDACSRSSPGITIAHTHHTHLHTTQSTNFIGGCSGSKQERHSTQGIEGCKGAAAGTVHEIISLDTARLLAGRLSCRPFLPGVQLNQHLRRPNKARDMKFATYYTITTQMVQQAQWQLRAHKDWSAGFRVTHKTAATCTSHRCNKPTADMRDTLHLIQLLFSEKHRNAKDNLMLTNQLQEYSIYRKLHKRFHASKRQSGHTAADPLGRTAAAKGQKEDSESIQSLKKGGKEITHSELLPNRHRVSRERAHNCRKRGWGHPETMFARKAKCCARRRTSRRPGTIQHNKKEAKVDGAVLDPAHQPEFCRSREADPDKIQHKQIKWQDLKMVDGNCCENPKSKDCKKGHDNPEPQHRYPNTIRVASLSTHGPNLGEVFRLMDKHNIHILVAREVMIPTCRNLRYRIDE